MFPGPIVVAECQMPGRPHTGVFGVFFFSFFFPCLSVACAQLWRRPWEGKERERKKNLDGSNWTPTDGETPTTTTPKDCRRWTSQHSHTAPTPNRPASLSTDPPPPSHRTVQMTSSVHTNAHLSRRASVAATAPYTIPAKTGSSPSPSKHAHAPSHRDREQLSASVPVLSREFVVRRISEGETGRLKEELKCEACGKGYKHISSLAKHLWEHTPEWNVTKKLLISKHQQVQLLEAASILVSMNDRDELQFTPKFKDNMSGSLDSKRYDSAMKKRMNSISNDTVQLPQLTEMRSPSPKFGVLDVPKEEDDDNDDDGEVFGMD